MIQTVLETSVFSIHISFEFGNAFHPEVKILPHHEEVKTRPNQKPWLDGSIRTKLKVWTTAFNHGKFTGNMAEHRVVIPATRQSKQNISRQSGVAIQRLRHKTYVLGTTDDHGLEKENQPRRRHRLLASRQAKHVICSFEDNTVQSTQPATKELWALFLCGQNEQDI